MLMVYKVRLYDSDVRLPGPVVVVTSSSFSSSGWPVTVGPSDTQQQEDVMSITDRDYHFTVSVQSLQRLE